VLLLIGSIGPLGHAPASGTVTVAVIGLPLFYLMHTWPWWAYTIVSIVFIGSSVWVHHIGDRVLGEKDSRKLVWDELAGFLIAVAFVPFTWQLALLAFLLERFLDIVKIPPAGWIERSWPGGWGVVGDDVVAGLYTRLILLGVMPFCPPTWLGLSA
jgi:phosphatidylglycerophosphatase A